MCPQHVFKLIHPRKQYCRKTWFAIKLATMPNQGNNKCTLNTWEISSRNSEPSSYNQHPKLHYELYTYHLYLVVVEKEDASMIFYSSCGRKEIGHLQVWPFTSCRYYSPIYGMYSPICKQLSKVLNGHNCMTPGPRP